jgi:pimeloyl-ACP methyl ester carboxylesterase
MPVLDVDGATITYEDAGSGDPVLLLHGFPTTRRLWRGVTPALIEGGFRVLVPDLVGYGDSSCPATAEPDLSSQATWITGLLDALGIDRFVLVAHDIGTAAAQLILARAPQRVRRLVLMDGVFGREWAMDAVAPICAWTEPARLHKVLLRQLRASGADGRLAEEAVRDVLAPYEGVDGGAKLIRAARAMRPEQTAEILPALRAASVPALVLWGEGDVYLGAEGVGRPLAELLRARLVLLPSGHFLPLERPDLVAEELISVLRSSA